MCECSLREHQSMNIRCWVIFYLPILKSDVIYGCSLRKLSYFENMHNGVFFELCQGQYPASRIIWLFLKMLQRTLFSHQQFLIFKNSIRFLLLWIFVKYNDFHFWPTIYLILTHPRKISITQLMLTQTHCCYTLRNCNFERLSRKWPRYFQQPSQNGVNFFLKKHSSFYELFFWRDILSVLFYHKAKLFQEVTFFIIIFTFT